MAARRAAALRSYWVFLISAFLFNAGHALLEVIDSNEAGLMNGIFSEAINCETLVLSFAGLAALHFGALLTLCVGWPPSPPTRSSFHRTTKGCRCRAWKPRRRDCRSCCPIGLRRKLWSCPSA